MTPLRDRRPKRTWVRAKVGVKDNLTVIVWNASTPNLEVLAQQDDGVILDMFSESNLVVTAGLNLLRDLLDTRTMHSVNGITHFAIGTSNTAVVAGDTALGAQILREPLTQSIKTNLQVSFKFFLGTGALNGQTLREMGLFNNPTGPTMFSRRVLASPISKTSSIAVTFVWDIPFSAL